MVIANGRLYWIADAYTTTSRYPYSQPLGGMNSMNYIRNAVKVVVDAYNGSMALYVFDPADPIIRTYEKVFPGVFKPMAAMDATLRAHVRYPQDFFTAQTELFATYHVTDPSLLYNKGNQWQVPTGVSITGGGQMNPYYMIMRLPGQTREEFVLILPFTPNGRSNMIGWLGAESDFPNYGKAVSFEFPSSLNVYGPAQVEAAVNQNPTISAQRTLWGQHGSRVIFGNLIVVPIVDSLLYVQPLYLESEQTQLPQVQRVIVFYRAPSATANLPPTGQQQNVVMAPTLDGALAEVFGGAPAAGPPSGPAAGAPPTAAAARLIARANAQYERRATGSQGRRSRGVRAADHGAGRDALAARRRCASSSPARRDRRPAVEQRCARHHSRSDPAPCADRARASRATRAGEPRALAPPQPRVHPRCSRAISTPTMNLAPQAPAKANPLREAEAFGLASPLADY